MECYLTCSKDIDFHHIPVCNRRSRNFGLKILVHFSRISAGFGTRLIMEYSIASPTNREVSSLRESKDRHCDVISSPTGCSLFVVLVEPASLFDDGCCIARVVDAGVTSADPTTRKVCGERVAHYPILI